MTNLLFFPPDIVLPRNKDDAPVSPVAFVLQLAAKPWALTSVAHAMRRGGHDIAPAMEAEMAASLHYLLVAVLTDPEHGIDKALSELRAFEGKLPG